MIKQTFTRCLHAGLVILAAFNFGAALSRGANLTYTLRVPADGNSTISGLTVSNGICCTNSINDSGTVVFYAGFPGGSGFFTPSNLLVRTGDTIGGFTLTGLHAAASWNNSGEIVFGGTFNGSQQGLFTQSSLLQTGLGFTPVALDNQGNVTFLGGVNQSTLSTPSGVIVSVGDTIAGRTLTSIDPPTTNGNGTLIFHAAFSGGDGIFTPTSLLVQSGDVIDGHVLTSIDGFFPVISNDGTLAFAAAFESTRGIFTQSHLLAKVGDTIGGQTLSAVFGDVAIDENGTVAFAALISGGGAGIFTQNALILRTGATLEGRTVTSVFNNGPNPKMNRSGQIAFLALSFDPSLGPPFPFVVVADPLLNVSIEVKPGDSTASINTGSMGTIPVAILSDAGFNALTSVNPTSLTFGETGNEPSLASCDSAGEDVNGDGLLDLVCHFTTQATGLKAGDSTATLKGAGITGTPLQGSYPVIVH